RGASSRQRGLASQFPNVAYGVEHRQSRIESAGVDVPGTRDAIEKLGLQLVLAQWQLRVATGKANLAAVERSAVLQANPHAVAVGERGLDRAGAINGGDLDSLHRLAHRLGIDELFAQLRPPHRAGD